MYFTMQGLALATRAELRKQLARDLGGLGPLPTGPSGVATSGGASTLIQNTWPVLSSIAKTDEYSGWYLLRPNAASDLDRVRQINAGNYDPTTGTFTVDKAWTNVPVSGTGNDTAYELHGHGFHPWEGIDELLNEGLKLIMVPVQVPYLPSYDSTPGNIPLGSKVQNLTNGNGSGAANTRLPWLLHPSWVTKIELLTQTAEFEISITQSGASTGNYTLSYGPYTTANIAWNDTGATVQTRLQALPGLSEVTVVRTGSSGSYIYTLTMPRLSRALTQFTATIGTYDGDLFFGEQPSASGPNLGQITGRLYQDGPSVLCECDRSFTGVNSFYVSALVRAYDWCRASSTAAFGSQSGVSAEAHEVVPVVGWVSLAAQIIAWQRAPKVMEEALEQRRVRALGDVIRNFRAYQNAYLRDIKRSPLLDYDVDGGVIAMPFPLAQGDTGTLPESALASTVRRAPTAA